MYSCCRRVNDALRCRASASNLIECLSLISSDPDNSRVTIVRTLLRDIRGPDSANDVAWCNHPISLLQDVICAWKIGVEEPLADGGIVFMETALGFRTRGPKIVWRRAEWSQLGGFGQRVGHSL